MLYNIAQKTVSDANYLSVNLDLKHNLSPVFYCSQWPIYPSYDWAHGLSDAIEADVEMGTGIMMIFWPPASVSLRVLFTELKISLVAPKLLDWS